MSTKKRFSPRIDGLEARVVLTHPSTQELVADVRRERLGPATLVRTADTREGGDRR